jgi:UDP-3-O-[3-hydroxymyristoyl] glucosamine N-acyltransferase
MYLEDDVDIGACTTIDLLPNNNYKKRRKLDNQIQVGHNVEIGEHRNCRSNWRCRFD